MRGTIGRLQANALANASTSPPLSVPDQHRRLLPPHRQREHAHPIYQVGHVYLHGEPIISQPQKKTKKRCVCTPTPTSKEDQVHGGIRMVRGTIHPILRHLCPRDDLHVLQSLAQRLDLRLFLIILLEHERVLIGRAPRVACLQ